MRSHKLWMCSNLLKPKLNSNLARRLKLSNLTMVVSTMVDMMALENNVEDLSLSS